MGIPEKANSSKRANSAELNMFEDFVSPCEFPEIKREGKESFLIHGE
jgi:hypothetical protein